MTQPSATIFILAMVSRMTAKSILSDLTVGRDVVRRVDIALVDLAPRNELVDIDGPRAFNLNGLELLVLDNEILAFPDLIESRRRVGQGGWSDAHSTNGRPPDALVVTIGFLDASEQGLLE